MGIESQLVIDKFRRSDGETYKGDLLVRQRKVNYSVVNYASEFLPSGSLVVDACAGPEGSLLASSLLSYRWIGNDLSWQFAKDIRQTGASRIVLSDFSNSPYKSEFADGVFMIFALNNIDATDNAISEASRILKPRGTLAISDPGPSMWISKILRCSVAESLPNSLRSECDEERVRHYFDGKDYTLGEYADQYIKSRLGWTREQFLERIKVLQPEEPRKIAFKVNMIIKSRYLEHIVEITQNHDMRLVRHGIILLSKRSNAPDWEVSPVITLGSGDVLSNYEKVLKWEEDVRKYFPEARGSSTRIVANAMCFIKAPVNPSVE